MKRKAVIILSLILVLALLLVGCGPKSSPKKKPTPTVTDEDKIRSQMATWAEAWETQDPNNLRTTMVETDFSFTCTGGLADKELTGLTIDGFVMAARYYLFWGLYTSSRVDINSITIDGKSASLKGEWANGNDLGGLIYTVEAGFLKDDEQWLISSLVITLSGGYFEGEENEEYDEERHASYISFEIGEEHYIFHDQYGGNDREMVSYNPSHTFSIRAEKVSGWVTLTLDFSLEGESGNPEFVSGICYNEAGDRYETKAPDFIKSMEADFVNGSVHGTFSGEMESEDKDIVEITNGEFHFNHEFNPPVVTIDKEEEPVSGLIAISGTWYDESELSHIWVSIYHHSTSEGSDDQGAAIIGDDHTWTFPFDSNIVSDGECTITVYAVDKYWATSEEAVSTMIVKNESP